MIPCTPNGAAHWVQRTPIAGREYVLEFRWNQREGHWFLSVADQDGAPIAGPVKLVTNWPLLRTVLDPRRPPGELYVVDAQGEGLDPGFADLGTRFTLLYVDEVL